jgi:hypothetical protein
MAGRKATVIGEVVKHTAAKTKATCEISAPGFTREDVDVNILSPSKIPVSYRCEKCLRWRYNFLTSALFAVNEATGGYLVSYDSLNSKKLSGIWLISAITRFVLIVVAFETTEVIVCQIPTPQDYLYCPMITKRFWSVDQYSTYYKSTFNKPCQFLKYCRGMK